ncbi:drug resistance transporter, EmrB/QacA subfamily [Rhizobiales bacterium GAS191]|nr:drug resistance transporter, EmrB/QacA subfamily [Rhizobiales bacterium GAS191]
MLAGEEPKLGPAGLVVLLSGVFLAVMSTFIVNLAIPSIQRDLSASPSEMSAVVAYYGLAYGAMLITGGRLGDIYGRRGLFVLGLAGFTVSALICGLAGSVSILIGARIAEGIAAAAMFPQILSVIRVTSADEHARARAFAAFGVALGLSGIAGPLIGGALIAADLWGTGWRAVFLFNVPIGLIACFSAMRLIPETRAGGTARLDASGALLCAVGLGLLLYPLIVGQGAGWPSWTLISMAAAALTLVLFILDQRRKSGNGKSPVIEPGLFKIPSFSSGVAIAFLFHSTIVAFLYALALFLQTGLDYSPWHAALITAPIPAAFLLTSPIAGRLLPSYGSFPMMCLGGAVVALGYGGCAWIAVNQDVAGGWGLVPALVATGIGQGLFLPPLLNAVLASTSKEYAGQAAGLVATAQQVGGAFGVATTSMLYVSVAAPAASTHLRDAGDAFGLALTYEIGAAVLALCLLPILFRRTLAVQIPAQ